MLLGLKLLGDVQDKPKNGRFCITHNNQTITGEDANFCRMDGDRFFCAASFGEKNHLIQLPRLSGGEASVNFGELTLDLTLCGELAPDAAVDLTCTFGSMEVLVPKKWRVAPASSSSFGGVDTEGACAPDADQVLKLTCSVSFGEITIRYV